MLKLIQTEFWKLRRKSLFWLMLLTALLMPFFAVIYFRSFGKTDLDPLLFYKWSAFGYTVFMILPFILGIVCTILMHEENQAHVLKQLWIIPIPKTACFFSKFFIVLMYSFCFMLITAAASVLFGIASGCAPFSMGKHSVSVEKMSGNRCSVCMFYTADSGCCCFTKGICPAGLYHPALYFLWIFYPAGKSLCTSNSQSLCNSCQRGKDSGTDSYANHFCSVGASLYRHLGYCFCLLCNNFFKEKGVNI